MIGWSVIYNCGIAWLYLLDLEATKSHAPESSFQRSNFDYVFLVDTTIRRLLLPNHPNAILMAFCWRNYGGPTLNAVLVALCFHRGSGPYIFVIFQGGGVRTLYPHLWIHAWIWLCCKRSTKAQSSLWSVALLFALRMHNSKYCYMQNSNFQANHCSWADWVEAYQVANSKWKFSCDGARMRFLGLLYYSL